MKNRLELLEKVDHEIRKERLLDQGDGIVVAVSGGPDSVALLHLLFVLSADWGWELTVAHVNHGFRPAESLAEEQAVRALAGTLALRYETAAFDMPGLIQATGMNPQAAARERRYQFLQETAQRLGASRIALGHHADDQAETVLMRLLRGTGVSGLKGIPSRRSLSQGVELVRPLLRITKSELLNYCERQHLAYVTDSSNLKPDYARNRVRLEALPFLQRYNEQLPEALCRLADTAAAEDDYAERETIRIFTAEVTAGEGAYSWSSLWFAGVHVALQRRLIKLILSYLSCGTDSMDFHQIERIRAFAALREAANASFDIGDGIRATRAYDRMTLHRMILRPLPYAYDIVPEQSGLALPEVQGTLAFRWLTTPQPPMADDPAEAWFDAELLRFPLTVRSRRPGDRIRPFGLNGSKKVKDMFIDLKLPAPLRDRIPIVADATGQVLWVAGVRRSAVAPVTEQTRRLLQARLFMPDFLHTSACEDT